MNKVDYEKFKQSGTPEAEAITFLEKETTRKLQEAVKNICDIVISKYDHEIAFNRNKIDELRKELSLYDCVLWSENSV